jgi:hypothetical protein
MRQQLLDAIYGGKPFRTVLRDLGLTSNQVWGLANIDQGWAEKLNTALTAARRTDLVAEQVPDEMDPAALNAGTPPRAFA